MLRPSGAEGFVPNDPCPPQCTCSMICHPWVSMEVNPVSLMSGAGGVSDQLDPGQGRRRLVPEAQVKTDSLLHSLSFQGPLLPFIDIFF